MNQPELTDPAWEIAAIIRELKDIGTDGEPTATVLGAYFGVETSSPEFVEIIASIRRRLARLDEFAAHVPDPSILPELRLQVRRAIAQFSSLFEPMRLTVPWRDQKGRASADDSTTLFWFSPTARRHRPLRLPSEEERKALLEQLEAIVCDVEESTAVTGWNRDVLVAGLDQLRTRLTYLRFFGVEQLTFDLVTVSGLAQEALEVEAANTPGSESALAEPSALRKLEKWLTRAALAVALSTGPDQAMTALGHYNDLFHHRLVYSGRPPEPKRLPAPQTEVAILPSRTDEEASTNSH